MKVQLWSVDKVFPYQRNPRRNEDAVEKVAASIKEFGFKQPIVVHKDSVIPSTRLETPVALVPKPKKSDDHPTMKPVALIERLLRNSTKKKDLVFDPFAGLRTPATWKVPRSANSRNMSRCAACSRSDSAIPGWPPSNCLSPRDAHLAVAGCHIVILVP
jgi:DNA methylase/ParB-like nuclease domain